MANQTLHKIHQDIENFEKHFDQDFFADIPQIYQGKPFSPDPALPTALLIIAPLSGSGKDTILDELVSLGILRHVVTATSRKRRYNFVKDLDETKKSEMIDTLNSLQNQEYKDKLDEYASQGLLTPEPFEKYVWMRQPKPEDLKSAESLEIFRQQLAEEYDLVESDAHYDTVYGLPRASLEQAKKFKEIPTIRTEVKGAMTLNKILAGQFNVLTLAVLPDSVEESINRIKKRTGKSQKDDENYELRLNQDLETMFLFPRVTNFYIHNSFQDINGKSGLETSVDSVIQLLKNLNLISPDS